MSNEITANISTNENPVTFTGTISYYNMPHAGEGGFEIDSALNQLISMGRRNKYLADEGLPEYPKHEPATRALARQTFRIRGKDPNIESNACECLAAALCEHINRFIDYISNGTIEIDKIIELAETPGHQAYMLVNNFLRENMARLVSKSSNGAFGMDAILAQYIEGIGPKGKSLAAKIIEKSRERMSSWDGAEWSFDKSMSLLIPGAENERVPWYLWCTQTPEEGEPGRQGEKDNSFFRKIRLPRAFHVLACVLWEDEVEPQVRAQNYEIKGRRHNNDDHTTASKALASSIWILGGRGIPEEDNPESERIMGSEGEQYQIIPRYVRYASRSAELLQACRSKLRNPASVELHELPDSQQPLFTLQCIRNGPTVLSPTASRLFALWLIITKKKLIKGTVGSITRELYPGTARLQRRNYEDTVIAANELRRVFVCLQSDDTATNVFDILAPRSTANLNEDQPIYWGYTRTFLEVLKRPCFQGGFMINLSRSMQLNGNETNLLRHYLLAADLFNNAHDRDTGRFNPNLVKSYPTHEWAAATNNLNSESLEYYSAFQDGSLNSIPSERRRYLSNKKSKDLQKVIKDLQDLEKRGLLIVDVATTKEVRVLPTQAHIEAYDLQRASGSRPLR